MLSQDDYYRDTSHLSRAERTAVNYDEPESYDLDLLRRTSRGASLRWIRPAIWTTTSRTGARRVSRLARPDEAGDRGGGVRASGIRGSGRRRTSASCWRAISTCFSRRRIDRDGAERAYTPAEVRERFENMVVPAQRRYLGGAADAADLIFPADWDDECVDRAAACVTG